MSGWSRRLAAPAAGVRDVEGLPMSHLSVLKALPLLLLGLMAVVAMPAAAQQRQQTYSSSELVDTGHKFFG